MRFTNKLMIGIAGLVLSATAAQAVTIVQYRQASGTSTVRLTNTSGGAYTLNSIGTPRVRVTLFDPNDISNTIQVDARFAFAAAGDEAASIAGDVASQLLETGTFSLTAINSFEFLGSTGTNILSGSFTNGVLSGGLGTRNPTASVSLPVASIFGVSSTFFDFDGYRLEDFSITTSGAAPALSIGSDGRFRGFRAASVGTFDVQPTSVIPEPATWAMMILGFGMVGAAMRRRPAVARTLA